MDLVVIFELTPSVTSPPLMTTQADSREWTEIERSRNKSVI